MKSVVLFGDSLFGRFGTDLLNQLESKLSDTVVYNCAAGGQNSSDGAKRASFIAKLKPDYVFVCFGANDAAPWKTQTDPEKFRSNLNQIFDAFHDSRIVVLVCPDADESIDPQHNEFNKSLKSYDQILNEICTARDIPQVSSEVYGETLKNGNDHHFGDGVHLNVHGYELVIDEFVRIVNS